MTDYTVSWELLENGVPVQSGDALVGPRKYLGPRESMTYTIPYNLSAINPKSEYYVNVYFKLATDKPWAKTGYIQMSEQLPVAAASSANEGVAARCGLVSESTDSTVTVSGNNFSATFNTRTGALCGLDYGGKQIVAPGSELALDAFRAYLNNDAWVYGGWFSNGLYNLRHKQCRQKCLMRQTVARFSASLLSRRLRTEAE